MAQIKVRHGKGGVARYTAVIRISKKGTIVHQEARTFPRQTLAENWARAREVELADPATLPTEQFGDTSIRALIERYVNEFEASADGENSWGRTKSSDLRKLMNFSIAKYDARSLTPARIVQHVKERRADGVAAQTVLNDLVWLGVVFRIAKGAWGIPARADVIADAKELCYQLRLVSKSKQRDRLPSFEELNSLDQYFEQQDKRSEIPMRIVMWFAIYSSRRQSEICRIFWTDQNSDLKTGMVRDAKHPNGARGNHKIFRYTENAWKLVELQPHTDERIFPYNSKSVGKRFTDACKVLGIKDLRFHDLRHDAITRLFEQGKTIPEVSAISLHASWSSLKVYTNLSKRNRVFNAPLLSDSSTILPSPDERARQEEQRGHATK